MIDRAAEKGKNINKEIFQNIFPELKSTSLQIKKVHHEASTKFQNIEKKNLENFRQKD